VCGLGGFIAAPDEQFNANVLASALLINIEERGKDATGAAWFDNDGVLMTQKAAMPARWFVQGIDLPEDARCSILHTRAATQGSEKDNNNNHPVITGGIVGVHNGVLWNDDSLFRRMGIERIAEVDTEAAFAAIAYGTQIHEEDNKPRLAADLKGVLEEIEGSAALAWMTVGKPNELNLARVSQSPLVVAKTTGGSIVFASTLSAIKAGLAAAGLELKDHAYAKEGEYFRFEGNKVVDSFTFKVDTYVSSWGGGYGYSSYTSTHSSYTSTSTVRVDTESAFKPWIAPVSLLPHVSEMFNKLPKRDDEEHHKLYLHRERAIDRFMEGMTKSEDINDFGAYYRVGQEVLTDLPGRSGTFTGHIVMMPQQFPEGEYLIRVLAPNKRYAHGYEPVLVLRELNEFVTVDPIIESDDNELADQVGEEIIAEIGGVLPVDIVGELEAGKDDELTDA
jgi:predicted glutamine amidotransferase